MRLLREPNWDMRVSQSNFFDVLWVLFTLGIVRALPIDWPPQFIDATTSLIVVSYTCSFILFFVVLVNEYRANKWLHACICACLTWWPIGTYLILSGDALAALKLNAFISLGATMIILLVILTSNPEAGKRTTYVSKQLLA
jgi:hypothetical protein